MDFYSYLWLREDGTPYYAGKGTGKRAFIRGGHRLRPPANHSRIMVFPMVNEAEAFESEIALIELFGRKDLGTGCLRNLTDGGENPPKGCLKGRHLSKEHKKKLSTAHLGKPNWKLRGQKRSVETIHRMSKPRSHSWRLSDETKQNMTAVAVRREAKKKEQGLHCGQVFGYRHTDEAKKKMSAAKKGKPSWNLGRSPSDETRAIWSLQRKGKLWSTARRLRHEEKKNVKL